MDQNLKASSPYVKQPTDRARMRPWLAVIATIACFGYLMCGGHDPATIDLPSPPSAGGPALKRGFSQEFGGDNEPASGRESALHPRDHGKSGVGDRVMGRVVDAGGNSIADVCVLSGSAEDCEALASEDKALFHFGAVLARRGSTSKYFNANLSHSDAGGFFSVGATCKRVLLADGERGLHLCDVPKHDHDWVVILKRCPRIVGRVNGLQVATTLELSRDRRHIMALSVESNGSFGTFLTPPLLPGNYWLRGSMVTKRDVVIVSEAADVHVEMELRGASLVQSWSAYLIDQSQRPYIGTRIESELGCPAAELRIVLTAEAPNFARCVVDAEAHSLKYDESTGMLSGTPPATARHLSLWRGWKLLGRGLIDISQPHVVIAPSTPGPLSTLQVIVSGDFPNAKSTWTAQFGVRSMGGYAVGAVATSNNAVCALELPAWQSGTEGWLSVQAAGHVTAWRQLKTPSLGGAQSIEVPLSKAESSLLVRSSHAMAGAVFSSAGDCIAGALHPLAFANGLTTIDGLPRGPLLILAWDGSGFSRNRIHMLPGAGNSVSLDRQGGDVVSVRIKQPKGISIRCFGADGLLYDGVIANRRHFGGVFDMSVPVGTMRVEFVDTHGTVLAHESAGPASFTIL